jgi:DUF4097 and DUF4098 domain-containing protein YvlB
MKKFLKVLFAIVFVLLILGVFLYFGGGLKWLVEKGIIKLKRPEYKKTLYEINRQVCDIKIEAKSSSVQILSSDDGKIRVECDDTDRVIHTVVANDYRLEIVAEDSREWYEITDVIFDSAVVKVYLPESEYRKLEIKLESGNIYIGTGINLGDVFMETVSGSVELFSDVKEATVNTTSGNVTVKNINIERKIHIEPRGGNTSVSECRGNVEVYPVTGNVDIENSRGLDVFVNSISGNVKISDVIGEQFIYLYVETGNVTISHSDADDINIETKSGNVTASFRSSKRFDVISNTGNINVPETNEGSPCKVETKTGNVNITIDE